MSGTPQAHGVLSLFLPPTTRYDPAMQETPQQIAARLMAPASTSALWTHEQVEALIIEAVKEERGERQPRPPKKSR